MKPQQSLIEKKQKQLTSKKQQNKSHVEKIQNLKKEIEDLKWKIPAIGIQDDIEQLKQSIKIPSLIKKQSTPPIQQMIEQQQKRVKKESDKKIIKNLQAKREMLQKLDKLKIEGNLYQSHRRVILKQYLQQLRQKLKKQKQLVSKMQEQSIEIQKLKKDYTNLLTTLDKSSQQLSLSRMF